MYIYIYILLQITTALGKQPMLVSPISVCVFVCVCVCVCVCAYFCVFVLGKKPVLCTYTHTYTHMHCFNQVMEHMTMGSLCDLLLNESYPLEADTLLLMLRDIVQGIERLLTIFYYEIYVYRCVVS